MIKVKLGSVYYSLPEKWDEITLEKFKSIVQINEEQDEFDYKLEILSTVLGCSIEELEQSSLNSLNSLWNRFSELINNKPSEQLSSTFFIDGKEFYFDNELDKNTTYGMFVDLSTFMKDGNFWENAEKVLAILIRPVQSKKKNFSKWRGLNIKNYPDLVKVEKYNSDKLEEHSKYLLKCPMSYIFPVALFFWNFLKILSENILQSSNPSLMMMKNQLENLNSKIIPTPLVSDGDGIPHFTRFAEIKSGNLKNSQI